CASELYSGGLDLVAIQEILGRSWIATTMRYVNPRELHQTGEKLQVARSRRESEGLQRSYELTA
ncbi:integrase, partial [Kitasatospora sp. NPDC056783]